MITPERLQAAKNYMRVDFPQDDALITALLCAADEYLFNAGVRRDDEPQMYDLIAWDMTLRAYENRGGENTAPMSLTARYMLNQLKLSAIGRSEINETDGGRTAPTDNNL